jgi:hypothetical protein
MATPRLAAAHPILLTIEKYTATFNVGTAIYASGSGTPLRLHNVVVTDNAGKPASPCTMIERTQPGRIRIGRTLTRTVRGGTILGMAGKLSNGVSFAALGQRPSWIDHIRSRFSEAVGSGLIHRGCAVDVSSAIAVTPTGLDLATVRPTVSLRIAIGSQVAPDETGWLERRDLFEHAASWLTARSGERWLLCEAGLSRVGDQVLSRRTHVVWNDRPFLLADLRASDETVATYLRWGARLSPIGRL